MQKAKSLKPVEITWSTEKLSLSEIYSMGLEYCFIGQKWQQCCAFVHCKDFLQDAMVGLYHNKAIECFGFQYDPKKWPYIYTNRTRLALANRSDKNFADKIPAVLDFVHQIEEKLHLIRSSVRGVANPHKRYDGGRIFVFEGSSRWILSPPMLSMYTLLLRAGFRHKKGQTYTDTIKQIIGHKVKPYQREDASQLEEAQSGIDRIMKYGYAKIFYNDPKKNYPNKSTYSIHNHSGICAFASEDSKCISEHWHRKLSEPSKKKRQVENAA